VRTWAAAPKMVSLLLLCDQPRPKNVASSHDIFYPSHNVFHRLGARIRQALTCHMIVWDIETVPDLAGFAAANGHDGKSDEKFAPGANYQSTFSTRFVRFGASARSDWSPFPSF
jgi:hypothetical protein